MVTFACIGRGHGHHIWIEAGFEGRRKRQEAAIRLTASACLKAMDTISTLAYPHVAYKR
jgi:hypothetical protein